MLGPLRHLAEADFMFRRVPQNGELNSAIAPLLSKLANRMSHSFMERFRVDFDGLLKLLGVEKASPAAAMKA
jgi:hypothetical protein